jgi:hypothetical protein
MWIYPVRPQFERKEGFDDIACLLQLFSEGSFRLEDKRETTNLVLRAPKSLCLYMMSECMMLFPYYEWDVDQKSSTSDRAE